MKNMKNEGFCNNCGKKGHLFHQCKMPITSVGIIAFRKCPKGPDYEYLMIRRKDTLGYLDFMRGKYSVYQKSYIMNMMKQMTHAEKELLRQKYYHIRAIGNINVKDKTNILIMGIEHNGEEYDLLSLLNESERFGTWTEAEWGFPKGRRNSNENDYDCAVREFTEETGYSASLLNNIRNMVPVEEVFTGSNYNSYKHKYYLMYMDYETTVNQCSFQKSEVGEMQWKTAEQGLSTIRPYNLEKLHMLQKLDKCLKSIEMVCIDLGTL
jgi:8-oxo-dGTP pyrophosphatase MutT (NUDIX family)